MSVTSNLKKQVDLPVFEWTRPLPVANTAVSCFTTANSLQAQYIYYMVGSAFYRYDTVSDSWQQLANPIITPATFVEMGYSSAVGHYGRAISNGGGNNTMELAGFCGNALVGYKIRIIGGRGMGQERTIVSVSDPIIKDSGVVTTGSTTTITDASTGPGLKQWKINQYRDYQVRIWYGSGVSQIRPILYNSVNALTIYDANYSAVTPWWGPALAPTTSTTAGAQSLYTIESNIITVDSNWDTTPDSTSQFVILCGGIWAISGATTANGSFSLQYYDVIADVWYQKSIQNNLFLVVPSDISFERFTENGGFVLSGTATSGADRSITQIGANAVPNRYRNFEVRITGGTGMGQTRTILSNTSETCYVTRSWDVIPDNTSTYAVYRDCGKLMLTAGTYSSMLQYSQDSDQWTTGKQLDYGTARSFSVKEDGLEPLAVSGITRTSGGVISLDSTPTVGGSGYSVDQILTISTGGANATARITGVNTSGAVTSVVLENCGSGYTTGTKATTVSPAGGTGCTLNILTIGEIGTATTVVAHNIKIGTTVTIAGATLSEYNGSKVILGTPSTTTIQYQIIGTPASPAVSTASQSGTLLVDVTKNWVAGEHIGKLVQLSTPGPIGTGQVRRITANTANTLSFASATAPANGTSRYVIVDPKPFGTEISIGGRTGGGREGFATSGTNASLTDTTKNWPTNYWSTVGVLGTSGRKVRIIAGTGVGNEIVITSNTNNTLNFAPQAFTVDSTTQYVIMDNFGVVNATSSSTTLVDTTQNWATNIWAGKRVRYLSGTGMGNEYTITSNTATTLTFAAGTTPDTTTQYAILEPAPRGTGIHLDCVVGSTDATKNNRYLYSWRGGATPELARYDFTTEQYDLFTYFPITETLSTGSMYVYDGHDRIYFTKDSTGRIMYYDVVKNIVVPSGTLPYGMGSAIIGNRMEIIETEDGLHYLYAARHSSQEMWRTLLFW